MKARFIDLGKTGIFGIYKCTSEGDYKNKINVHVTPIDENNDSIKEIVFKNIDKSKLISHNYQNGNITYVNTDSNVIIKRKKNKISINELFKM